MKNVTESEGSHLSTHSETDGPDAQKETLSIYPHAYCLLIFGKLM